MGTKTITTKTKSAKAMLGDGAEPMRDEQISFNNIKPEWPIGDSHGDAAYVVTTPALIIGAGPVGVRIAQNLSANGVNVAIFNAETQKPYNRVQLTPFLAEDAQIEDIYLSEKFPGPGRVDRYDGVAIIDIDRERKLALASNGRVWRYDHLIFATGSYAFVPSIEGVELKGVYTFRDIKDAQDLIEQSQRAKNIIVLGGGLLGLEAARGLQRRGCRVTVIEHNTRLMHKQLDDDAAEILKQRIEALGVRVITGMRLSAIDGNDSASDAQSDHVKAVTLGNGEILPADLVVVCAGVRPKTDLAASIGLRCGLGVLVDNQLRTSDPSIFAVGECAEHEGIVYGLVGPGFEQAEIAADVIAKDVGVYKGSTACSKLKVLGVDVFSIGEFEYYQEVPGVKQFFYSDPAKGVYRRLTTFRGRLVAALGVGPWPESSRLQKAASEQWRVNFLNTQRFRKSGVIWKVEDDNVFAMPDEAIICNCTGTTKGTIVGSIATGAKTIEDVRVMTGANTVCGSCGVQISQLLDGDGASAEPVKWWQWLVGLSIAAVSMAMLTGVAPPIPIPNVWSQDDLLRALWFENALKQWSGYTLMGLTGAAAILGLRKRIGFLSRLGDYQIWRVIHLLIGAACAIALVWHTGFRLGSNLNFYLMLSFLATLIFGAIAGMITGGEHELRNRSIVSGSKSPRRLPLWIHIIALWPLPILLLFHILSVYLY